MEQISGILCLKNRQLWNTEKFAKQIFGAPKIPKGFFSVLSVKNHFMLLMIGQHTTNLIKIKNF